MTLSWHRPDEVRFGDLVVVEGQQAAARRFISSVMSKASIFVNDPGFRDADESTRHVSDRVCGTQFSSVAAGEYRVDWR